jgi:DNA-binding response OmpR family regulator
LRRKIEADPAQPQFIKTERGAGYVFAASVELVQ